MLGIFNRNNQPKAAAKVEVDPYSYRNENGKKVNVPAHERTIYRNQVDPTAELHQKIESLKDLVQEQQALIGEQRQMIEALRQGCGVSEVGDWRTKAEWSDVVIDHLVEMVDVSILYRLKGILRGYGGSVRVAPVGFRRNRDKPSLGR